MTTKNESTPIQYLDAYNWAKLAAYIWMRPIMADAFETDPVKAIVEAQNDPEHPIHLDYYFDFNDPPKQRTKLIKIPNNPGYNLEDLYHAVFGVATVVPMTSWSIHGVSTRSEDCK